MSWGNLRLITFKVKVFLVILIEISFHKGKFDALKLCPFLVIYLALIRRHLAKGRSEEDQVHYVCPLSIDLPTQ